MDQVLVSVVVCASECPSIWLKGTYLWFLRLSMLLTTFQLVQRPSQLTLTSDLSDITNMAVGQSRVMVASDVLHLQSCPISSICASDRAQRLSLALSCSLCRASLCHMSAASARRPVCRRACFCDLGQTIPKLACRTTLLALLASQVSWALCWIWGVGQVMFVGLCCLSAHKHFHLSQLCSQFDLQSTPQDTPSLTTHSRQMPWTTTEFPPLYNMPQQTT